MKINPIEFGTKIVKKLEPVLTKPVESVQANFPKVDAADCQSAIGKAQVAIQNTIKSPETAADIDKILNKIFESQGMQVGRHISDSRINIGRPLEGFKGLFRDDMNAKCIRDAKGYLSEIFVKDNNNKQIFIYDANGILKKHFNADDMKALFEYKYHPESIHDLLRRGKKIGIDSEESLRGWIDNIDKLFLDENKVWKTKEPKIVYRALQINLTEKQKSSLSQIGGVFEDLSFVSTTEELATAKRFSSGNPILEIELPKDSKYLDLDALFNVDRTHWREQEFLLPRASRFVVTGYDSASNVIKVKYLNK